MYICRHCLASFSMNRAYMQGIISLKCWLATKRSLNIFGTAGHDNSQAECPTQRYHPNMSLDAVKVKMCLPLCDLLHQRRARAPRAPNSAREKQFHGKKRTHQGSSFVASLTLASISLTLRTTFLAYIGWSDNAGKD